MQSIKPRASARVVSSPRNAHRAPLAYRLAHLIGRPVLRTLFRFEVTGTHHVPVGEPYIVVANHLNWLDGFALLLALPVEPQLHLVGWDTAMVAPKLSRLIKISKAAFIPLARDRFERSRRRRDLHRRLSSHLRAGGVLALFPEGSVGHVEGRLGPFQAGFANLACATGAVVLPVAISGTRRLWLRKRIRVVVGEVIQPAGLSRSDLLSVTHGALAAILPGYVDPPGPRFFERRLTELIPVLTDWRSGVDG